MERGFHIDFYYHLECIQEDLGPDSKLRLIRKFSGTTREPLDITIEQYMYLFDPVMAIQNPLNTFKTLY